MGKIYLNDISKKYGEKQVFQNLTLSFGTDGIYRITGPSGIGKTTLIRLLLNLERPDKGSIAGLPDKGQISAVFQEDRLIEELTAEKNIELALPGAFAAASGRDADGLGKDKSRSARPGLIDRRLSEIGLGGQSQRPVFELSGGMKRRVAIVRAMLHPGVLVIMDEPFTGLDEESMLLSGRYILNNLDGRGLIFASHIEDRLLCPAAEKIELM